MRAGSLRAGSLRAGSTRAGAIAWVVTVCLTVSLVGCLLSTLAPVAHASDPEPRSIEALLESLFLRQGNTIRTAALLPDTVYFGGSGAGDGTVVRGGIWEWEAGSAEPPEFFLDGDPVGNQFRDGWTFDDRTSRSGPAESGSGHWTEEGFYDFAYPDGGYAHRATFHDNDGVNDGPDPLEDPMYPGSLWSLWIGTNLYLNPEHCAWQQSAGYGNGWSQGIQKLYMVSESPGSPIDLLMYHRFACESGFDSCFVEISFDGLSWDRVGSDANPNGIFNGGSESAPLPTPFGGEQFVHLLDWPGGMGALFVRLRLASDAFFSDETDGGDLLYGWQVDNLTLLAGGLPVDFTDFEAPDPFLAMNGWQARRFEGFDAGITGEPYRPAGRIVDMEQLGCPITPPGGCGLAGNLLVFTDKDDCNLHDSFQDSYATSPPFAIGGPAHPDLDAHDGRLLVTDVYTDGGAGSFSTGLALCWIFTPYDSLACPNTPLPSQPGGGQTFNWSRTNLPADALPGCDFIVQNAGANCYSSLVDDISSGIPPRAESVILHVGIYSECRLNATCDPLDTGTPFYDNVRFAVYGDLPNQSPVCESGGPYAGTVGEEIGFNGTASFDPDGQIDLYEWEFGDGMLGTGALVTHAYGTPDLYTVTLTVTDNLLTSSSCATDAVISPLPNEPPVCEIGGPYAGELGSMIAFDGTGSFDPDGFIIAYDWDFGDGHLGSGPVATHAYDAADDYTLSLTLVDNGGWEITCGTIVEIVAPGQTCVWAPAGIDDYKSLVQMSLDLADFGLEMTVELIGPTQVTRSEPIELGELKQIDTEMVQFELTGISCLGPVHVSLNTDPIFRSFGQVTQLDPDGCFPGDSFFDLYLVIDVGGTLLHNELPIHIAGQASSLPPYNDAHTTDSAVDLFDEGGIVVGSMLETIHVPRPIYEGMFTTGAFELQIHHTPLETVQLDGALITRRGAPKAVGYPAQPDELWEIETEIVALDLRGDHSILGPLVVHLNPEEETVGLHTLTGFGGFPAESFFDVYYRIRFESRLDMGVQNASAAHMTSTINGLPPIGDTYLYDDVIPLEDWKPTGDPGGSTPGGDTTPTTPFPWDPYPYPWGDPYPFPWGLDSVLTYPWADTLCYCSTCDLTVRLQGGEPITIGGMQAQWWVGRDAPVDRLDGLAAVSTTTPELFISGFSPELGGDVFVQLNHQAPTSAGDIVQDLIGPNYPATSAMDFYVSVYLPGRSMVASNEEPFPVVASLNDIPFFGDHAGNQPVTLFDPGGTPVATLEGMFLAPQLPFDPSCPVSPDCGVTTVSVPDHLLAPGALRLLPSVPNPFSRSATIRFELAVAAAIEVRIFGVDGRLVRTLDVGQRASGGQEVVWDGRNDAGQQAASGLYLYSVIMPSREATGRLVLIR